MWKQLLLDPTMWWMLCARGSLAPDKQIVVSLEALLIDGASVSPAALLHLICRPQADELAAELAVRVLARRWMVRDACYWVLCAHTHTHAF